MNIEDKLSLYQEAHRVLAAGGRRGCRIVIVSATGRNNHGESEQDDSPVDSPHISLLLLDLRDFLPDRWYHFA